MPPKKKTTGFRLSAKGFFVTFPTCDVPKDVVKQRLLEKYPTQVKWGIIGQEHHQDESLHLHLALYFEQKQCFRNPNCFDFLTNQHGNYQTMKSPTKAIMYCKKEDTDPTIIGILPETCSKKAVSNEVATLVFQGASLLDVNGVAPGFLLLNFKKIQTYQWWGEREKEKMNKIIWSPLIVPIVGILSQPEIFIVNWLNKNIKKEREFKQKQLIIQAPTMHRKSSLVIQLDKFLTIMYCPTLEDFFDEWEEKTYDLLVFDEWEYQQHNPQFMNQILEGVPMNIRVKGSQKRKRENPPILILTNQSPLEAFGKGISPAVRDAFLSRVHWVLLDRPLPIETMFGGIDGVTILTGSSTTTTTTTTTIPSLNPTTNLVDCGSMIHPDHSHQSPNEKDEQSEEDDFLLPSDDELNF